MRRAVLPWVFMGALFVLCGVLGALQYRWIGEASAAARDRLRAALQANLNRLSRDFESDFGTAFRELLPGPDAAQPPASAAALERQVAARYRQWEQSGRGAQIFGRIALAVPEAKGLRLRSFDPRRGVFEDAAWPAEWLPLEHRIESHLKPNPTPAGNPASAVPFDPVVPTFELPAFGPVLAGGTGMPLARREVGWGIFELNLPYVRQVLLPELVQRHLQTGGNLEYEVAVVSSMPGQAIYESEPGAAGIAGSADATVMLLGAPNGRGLPGPPLRGSARGSDSGTWRMLVRHHAGSLEAVVARARGRSLAVTAGVLLLLIVTVGALIRFTRSAQRLADLQMNFVAGVSHELRTPLTVIYTAAYNLRGKLAQNPAQVERYGELIQKESGRLKDLVEQVLTFARANAGRIVQQREPVSVAQLIEQSLEASKPSLQAVHCAVERTVEPGLPPVLADPQALQQALQNLLGNAVKYGASDAAWVGISATRIGNGAHPMVEIRVADRGPGIPTDEQPHIFDPFFRGRRALQDQVHGTGLGLNLVKKIVEAHGGTIRVESETGRGAAFIVRIPALDAAREASG